MGQNGSKRGDLPESGAGGRAVAGDASAEAAAGGASSSSRGGSIKSSSKIFRGAEFSELSNQSSSSGDRPPSSKKAKSAAKSQQMVDEDGDEPMIDSAPAAAPKDPEAKDKKAGLDSFKMPAGMVINNKMTVDDFELMVVVGKGSFGKVMQVRKKDTGKIYAMKVLKKETLVKRQQVAHTRTERQVLAQIDHPFIVSIRYAFQTDAKLYMILDFFNGGELFYHLKNEGRFTEDRVRFYAAQIALALECLHKKNIVYRDLKPENVLLDSEGNIRITDFGLSKSSMESDTLTHTFCGTPEYLAPEVLQGRGHTRSVDWWSYGTLLYEMMTGLPPFYNPNVNIMYDRILHATIPFPEHLSPRARSLFIGLLQRDPSKRLGSGPIDAEEVRRHEFFLEIDWDKLYHKKVKAPFVPGVKDLSAVHFVDREFISETPRDTPDPSSLSNVLGKSAFPNFTYNPSFEDTPSGVGGVVTTPRSPTFQTPQ